MQKILIATLIGAGLLLAQEPGVSRDSIWIDTVKRGDMTRMVRGLGTVTGPKTAELKVAETQARQVRAGQKAVVDTRKGIVEGTVLRVNPVATNGTVEVEVQLIGALPAGTQPGLSVDGTVHIETLKDVMYVGRPVTGVAESEGTLYKIEADKQHAAKVRVQFGRGSVNSIEIRNGLQPGDQVILSDTSAFNTRDRLRLQ
jgi:HlyD family secretion protein